MIYRLLASTPCVHVKVSNLVFTPLVGGKVGLLKSTPRGSRWMSRVLSLPAALIVLCGLSFTASAQTASPPTLAATWVQQAPANAPSARGGQTMAYDAAHGQVVLFGGGGSYSDTWLWSGTNWTQANPVNSPPPRSAGAMAYDAATGQVVLFGGLIPNSNSIRLGDTWLWDGTNWTQAPAQANGPGARDGQTMVYDPVHQQVVMFGGISAQGTILNETWLWNGSTWTQASPTSTPTPRYSPALAYDAATGQVLLFGGAYGSNYLNDTWVWDGTNWTEQLPQTSPSPRYSMGMDYDAALGEVVLFGGYGGSGYQSDTWVWTGSNWVQSAPANNPSPRYFTQDMVYDAARGQMLMFGGFNFNNSPAVFGDTWEFGLPGNFGNVNVCPVGQVSPNGCGNTLTLTYSLPAATTTNFGATQVVTQGNGNLDFTLAAGGTCTGAVAGAGPQGNSGTCTVNIMFAPITAGLRMGAVNLVDNSGNLLASTPVRGVGLGPVAALGPGTEIYQQTNGNYPLQTPKGVTEDAGGNVYIADQGNARILMVTANGLVYPIGNGLQYPQGIAVDGAGNLFVADNLLNQVVEIPAGCTSSSCQVALGANLRSQLGVAVDGGGNVFIGDFLDGEIVKSPAGCASSACQTVVYGPAANSQPVGLAVDGAGNLFFADYQQAKVVEIPAGCTVSSCQVQVGIGWSQPEAVAVDAAGDVFVADLGLGEVVEVPAGCTSASCQTVVKSGVAPYGVAVSALGDVLVPDATTSIVYKFIRSQQLEYQFPTLSFAATNVGSTSSDSPQTVTLQNVGNQTLVAASPALLVVNGPNFVSVPGPGTPADCSGTSVLAPGAACDVSLSFTPQSGGSQLNSTATLNDNALSSGLGTQTIYLNGVGVSASFPLTVSLVGSGTGTVNDSTQLINCSLATGLTTGSCSANYSGGSQVTLTAIATGTSVFTGWSGACASAGTNPTCSFALTQAGSVTASFVNQNFGGVAVCPVGQVSQLICAHTLPVTFNVPANTTVGAIRVVTQGATGLDFNAGTGSTCTGTVSGACNVNVAFTPLAAGLRLGAVQLYDSNGNLVQSTPIYGVGQEPEIAFGPGTQMVVNTTASYPLNRPQGVAVDAAGDIFIADPVGQRVVKVAANGTVSTVGVGLSDPLGLAVDGAGNLYIADNNLNQVVEVPAGCSSSSCQVSVGSGLRTQQGVAVDGLGNVYISDSLDHEVVEVAANGGAQTVVYAPGRQANPVGVATDAAGNLFIADYGLAQVVEIPVGCVSSNCAIQVGSGWSLPMGVAVDAAGDVLVADLGIPAVVEVPAGCTSSACQMTVLAGVGPSQIAVDAKGTVLIPEPFSSQVVGVVRSQVPALSFQTTNVGSTSRDIETVTVQNIGNQPLTGSVALNLNGNFPLLLPSNCSLLFPLAPGASCNESFSFAPQSASFTQGTVTFSNNNLNAAAAQTVTLSGSGAVNGVPSLVTVPSVVGQTQAAAASPITSVGLAMGTVTTASSSTVASGSIIDQSPEPGTQVNLGSAVSLLVSTGVAQPAVPNPLVLENNYFVTGDYVSAGVTLRGTGGAGGLATGSIAIPSYASNPAGGVPDGADVVDAFLYWETVENTLTASSTTAIFNGYSVPGQQIGDDIPNYVNGNLTGTLRAYRAAVNAYLPARPSDGVRIATGTYTVSLPDAGVSALPQTEGASLVMVYRVLSPNFPLKSVVLYDGAGLIPASAFSSVQVVQGFYDAAGGGNATGKSTNVFAANGAWNNSVNTVALGSPNQYSAPLTPGNAYAAIILSTPVNNSDGDGILDAWKSGPGSGDFHAGQPGYYDAKTATWVGLPGAKKGQKDLFVQMDYMCGALLANGSCDPAQENLFPSPDANGNDPLAMVQKAFTASGVQLHLQIGNAIPEDTCVDDLTTTPATLCQFPNQPGVIGWKNSLEFSKLWPRNFAACLSGGDCTTRFPYGQKDSYHYVLFGHSLAIPAWNSRYGSLVSINVVNGVTTIVTTDRGTGISSCPSRFTLEGVIGRPELNGIYNTTGCADTKTITLATPGVPNWSYPNTTLAEPVIGLTSGTVTSISGYSDLGGSDSAVTLGLWLTYPNQDMSKKANVLAGTLFHEIGHTLGLGHGGIYYDTPGSYVATFEANCKPNYQSVMNYLFQLDLVGPNQTIAFSDQTLNTLNENTAGGTTQLTDTLGNPATFPTSAWYVPYTTGSLASPATRHCDGSPLSGDSGYRVDASIAPVTPPWTNGQDLSFDGVLETQERGYNDLANLDLRQVGATSSDFTSLASILNFGSSSAPLNISPGGSVTLGAGGTIDVGAGGGATLNNGGNATLGSSGTVELDGGGDVTLGNGGDVTLPDGGTAAPGSDGNVSLALGGRITLGSGGRITLGSGGDITLNLGGSVTLSSGGRITLGSGGVVIVPSTGGSYLVDAGGRITLGSGGSLTIGGGGDLTLGGAGIVSLASGGRITLGSGGRIALGSGGRITLGSGGRITLGSGGNITLGSGGRITLGSGGRITLGSGGAVSLGSGGTVTLGLGGSNALGGNVSLGSGGAATVGNGGSVTLSSGGTVSVNGNTSNISVGAGGRITLGSGGTISIGAGGTTIDLDAAGTFTADGTGIVTPLSAGRITLGSGGRITLGSGGNVTLDLGGTIALGSGGRITLGSGGRITLGSGGRITLGSGGVVSLGDTGSITLGSGSSTPLGSVPSSNSGSGGPPANELTYETANSVVRPPSLPTQTSTPAGVRINWTAPAFGVVQTYTIYRSSNGATPIVIGSVSGINGNPPATEFTDTNPDLISKTVVYTVTTTLVPDTAGPPRQSAPSPPAVVKTDQTIVLGPLPSSVVFGTATTVTATAMTGGKPNGLQVLFSAGGSCVIGSQSISSNVSAASVNLSTTGTCTVTASQPGATTFNAANSVSGTFMVLPKGSTLASQTINFTQLPNAQYGGSFSVSATSSAGLPVSLSATGPCTTGGIISGIGVCSITASAAGNASYSAASLTQSFTIYPAVLQVVANNVSTVYGQALPALTYNYSGFVKSDTAAVVSGMPGLTTTATPASSAGSYPITVSTGTLATPNYSFLYVSGTLTVQRASQSALTLIAASPLVYGQSEALSVTGGSTGGAVSYTVASGACTVSGSQLTATSGTGSCQVTATMAGNSNYSPVTSSAATVTLGKTSQTIVFSINPPASAAYGSSFTVAAAGTGVNAHGVLFSSAGACTNLGGTYTMTSGTGICSVIANQAGSSNYAAAPQVTKSVTATLAAPTVSFTGAPASAAYHAVFNVAASSNASSAAVISSSGSCTNAGTAVTITSGSGICSLTATWAADTNYSGTSAKLSTNATKVAPMVTFTGAPTSALYKSVFTVAATSNGSSAAVITSSGGCTNVGTKVTMTSGTTACSLTATWAADNNYSGITATQSTAAVAAPQAIAFTTNPPASAVYPGSFVVAASGGLSGNPVTFTSAGACSNSGATYTLTNSAGSCSVIANQAGNGNYAAATTATKSVSATGPSISASVSSINYGTVYLASVTTRSITVTNNGTSAATISDPIVSLVKGGNSNEFVAVNLCPKSLAAGKSCTITIGFVAGPFYTAQSATFQIMSNAPGSPLPIPLTAAVINPVASLNPTSLSFGTVKHATSSTMTVQLSNTGKTPLSLTSISVAGTNATSFVQSNACGNSLAAGANCNIAVKFTPATTGGFSAALTIVDNARNATQTVALSGTGN